MPSNPSTILAASLEDWQCRKGEHAIARPSLTEEEFRHGGWSARRRQIFAALQAAGTSDAVVERFACCGALAGVWWNDETGEVQVRGSHCKNRFCQPCATARGLALQRAMKARLPEGATLRFVTLTIRHQAEPLKDVLERLRHCFSRLRNRSFWKSHVTGGVQVLEVKLSKAGLWHPHLHMIVEGTRMPWEDLKAEWHKVTGDSFHVHIKMVADPADDCRDLGRYLTKYITKPAGLDLLNDRDKLVEYIVAMKGQRILNFLGTWRGMLAENEEAELETQHINQGWTYLAPLTQVLANAQKGDPMARNLVLMLAREKPETPPPKLLIIDHAN